MSLRIPTSIPGFDELVGGGIPVGSVVLLAGNAGSGKTLFTSHFISSNAKFGKALYCGFFEKKENFLSNSKSFGINLTALEQEGKLEISEYFPILETGISMLVSEIEKDIREYRPSLLIIDSVSTLAGDLKGRQEVRILLKMIDTITKSMNITVVLVTELPLNFSEVGFGVEEFIADSIIMLRYFEIEGEIKRCLAILKMRETSHDMHINEYVIGDKGMRVIGRLEGLDGLMLSGTKRSKRKLVEETQNPESND